eukprot:1507020-Pyramimonas_sp.AAC.1
MEQLEPAGARAGHSREAALLAYPPFCVLPPPESETRRLQFHIGSCLTFRREFRKSDLEMPSIQTHVVDTWRTGGDRSRIKPQPR